MEEQHAAKVRQKLFYYSLFAFLVLIVLPLLAVWGKYTYWALLATPFGIGYIFALIISLKRQRTRGEVIRDSLIPIVLCILSLVIFAREGAICLVIFGSILLIPYYIGVGVGFYTQKDAWTKNTLLLLIMACTFMSAVSVPEYKESKTVSDEVIIHAPASQVWNTITQSFSFGLSDNLFFKNGVSYPYQMQLKDTNARQFLLCRYNNGVVKAPVIEYIPGKSFSFTFDDSIITMKELNMYREAHTMHIQNHFVVNYGKFEIVPVTAQSCKLIATSNFKHKFEPELYTNIWVSYFLSKIHTHVLDAIKISTEARQKQPHS